MGNPIFIVGPDNNSLATVDRKNCIASLSSHDRLVCMVLRLIAFVVSANLFIRLELGDLC